MTYSKTGKTRYRVQPRWFTQPVLVLQIEVRRKGFEVVDSQGTTFHRDDCFWCDATVQDISEKEGQ